jgi:hypothetical protein
MSIRKPILTLFLATLLFSAIFSSYTFAGTVTIQGKAGSWTSINTAINSATAAAGDTFLCNGTFSETNITPTKDNITLQGNPYFIIDGAGAGRLIDMTGISFLTINDGTLQSGAVTASSSVSGKGAAIGGMTLHLTLHRCIFKNNVVSGDTNYFYGGGAIGANEASSNVVAYNTTFESNSMVGTGGLGGAIRVGNNGLQAYQCVFKNNSAYNGGAFAYGISGSTFVNCLFIGNSATYGGCIYDTAMNVNSCTFANNSGTNGSIAYGGSGTLTNSIIWGVSSALFSNGAPTVSYTAMPTAYQVSGGGNIATSDMKFASFPNDLHILYQSPAMKTANYSVSPGNDFDGNPRPEPGNYLLTDMGAYTYMGPFTKIDWPSATSIQAGTVYSIQAMICGIVTGHNTILRWSSDGGATWSTPLTTVPSTADYLNYSWTVPASVGSNNLISSEVTNGVNHYYGISASPFTIYINNPPTVTVQQPNGNEKLAGGSKYYVRWQGTDDRTIPYSNMGIDILYNNGGALTFVQTTFEGASGIGTYEWTVPMINSSNVKIRVVARDGEGGVTTDESNSTFTIDSLPPAVTVPTPESGRVFRGGGKVPINWTATDASGVSSETVKYSTDGTTWTTLASGLGSTVTTSEWSSIPYIDSALCRISVEATDVFLNVGRGISGAFSIMTSPDAVSNLASSSLSPTSARLTWTAPADNNNAANVSQYTGYASREPITPANYGASYQMSLHFFLPVAPAARGNPESIDVIGLDSGMGYYFAIKSQDVAGNWSLMSNTPTVNMADTFGPTVAVTSPNTAVVVNGGQTSTINWTASDPSGVSTEGITIRLSTDSGATWSLVRAGLGNTGSYSWNVPTYTHLITCRISVEAMDTLGNVGTDMSDVDFTVSTEGGPPTMESIRINGKLIGPGDIIAQNGIMYIKIKDTSGVTSVEMFIDGSATPICFTCSGVVTPEETWSALYSIPATQTGVHDLRFIVTNDLGLAITTTESVMVYTGAVQMIGKAYNFPNPFSPMSGDPALSQTNIQYQLSGDSEIKILIYDITGQHVYSKSYSSGSQGGRAGYNTITWNGRSLFKNVVGNGMYLYKIIAKDRAIGNGRLVVQDKPTEE